MLALPALAFSSLCSKGRRNAELLSSIYESAFGISQAGNPGSFSSSLVVPGFSMQAPQVVALIASNSKEHNAKDRTV